jgi:hypothetical protein
MAERRQGAGGLMEGGLELSEALAYRLSGKNVERAGAGKTKRLANEALPKADGFRGMSERRINRLPGRSAHMPMIE